MLNLKLGSTFCFTTEQKKYCFDIGRKRYETNRSQGIKEQKYTAHKSGLDLSIQGVLGEFAVLKMFELPLDTLNNTSLNNRYNDRGDMIYKGFKVDVKCPEGHHCPLQTRALNFSNQIKYPTQIYCLCTLQRQTITHGFNTKKRIRAEPLSSSSLSSSLEPNSSTENKKPKLATTTEPLQSDPQLNYHHHDAERISTYDVNDEIEVVFRGAIHAKKLFQPHFQQTKN
jgi:hypothetical protein